MTAKKIAYAFAATVLMTAGAQAADIARPVYKAAPVVAPMYNWSGFYVGGHAGWAWADSKVDGTTGTFDNNGPQSQTLKPDDWMWGGQIGYNWQVGNWVLGIEADLGELNPSANVTFFGPGSAGNDDIFSVSYGRYYTVTGRLGWAMDRALWYVKGGYVNAKISQTAGDTDGGNIDPTDSVAVSKNRGGWTLGGGLEYGLTPNWSVKVEYLYMDFSNVSIANLDAGNETYTFSDSVQTVKVGLNYRFDWGKAPVMAKY